LENDINARDTFDSHFMMSFITGKLIQNRYSHLFGRDENKSFIKRKFSLEAKAVFKAGKKLWTYYHAQRKCNVNASLHDIREYYQGRNDKGKMNNKSKDETYNELIGAFEVLRLKFLPTVQSPERRTYVCRYICTFRRLFRRYIPISSLNRFNRAGTIVLRVIYVLFRLAGLFGRQCKAVFPCIAALLRILGITRGLQAFIECDTFQVDTLVVGEMRKSFEFRNFYPNNPSVRTY
jgi:hypothetical protein